MEKRTEQAGRLRAQAVTLENREMLTVSGVRNADEFNDTEITLITDCGTLHIDGENLHITKLNLDDGIVSVEGLVCGIVFDDDDREQSGGFFSRLFR